MQVGGSGEADRVSTSHLGKMREASSLDQIESQAGLSSQIGKPGHDSKHLPVDAVSEALSSQVTVSEALEGAEAELKKSLDVPQDMLDQIQGAVTGADTAYESKGEINPEPYMKASTSLILLQTNLVLEGIERGVAGFAKELVSLVESGGMTETEAELAFDEKKADIDGAERSAGPVEEKKYEAEIHCKVSADRIVKSSLKGLKDKDKKAARKELRKQLKEGISERKSRLKQVRRRPPRELRVFNEAKAELLKQLPLAGAKAWMR